MPTVSISRNSGIDLGTPPIDATGQLITGERFVDWQELRALLVRDRKEDFVRCLSKHLLTYALGRGVTYHDKLTVREIVARGRPSNYAFQELIMAVCLSDSFQRFERRR